MGSAEGAGVKSAEEKWWDWVSPSRESFPDDAPEDTMKPFFSDLVKRCVLVESLSPLVTPQILLAAIDQFAAVMAIKMLRPPHIEAKVTLGVLPNYSGMAIMEMEQPQKADVVVAQLQNYMLMVGGMPRPARAQLAKPIMMVDHPCTRRHVPIPIKIVQATDDNVELYAAKRRKLVEHLKAAKYLRELQEREEEDLHNKQEKNYRDLKDKYNRIKANPDLKELRKQYNIMPRR